MSEVTMPRLSDTMQEGTIARWLKAPGEEIHKGEVLAVAATRKQFVPVEGQPVMRDLMTMTLSADHRILYGATVARFLQEVKRLLQNPYSLLG